MCNASGEFRPMPAGVDGEMSDVQIQCPECGGILKHLLNRDRWPGMLCLECKNYYIEAEIRERCGL